MHIHEARVSTLALKKLSPREVENYSTITLRTDRRDMEGISRIQETRKMQRRNTEPKEALENAGLTRNMELKIEDLSKSVYSHRVQSIFLEGAKQRKNKTDQVSGGSFWAE